LLKAGAKLKAVRTLNKRRVRMVKRRNSPYASFDQNRSRNVPVDSTPTLLTPLPLGPRQEWRHLDSG
jgi:hypothetical protein